MTTSGDPATPSPEDPAGRARALQYDLALNGWELGGGSIRIHRRDLLERSFLLQGQTAEGMHEKFGAVLDAFEFGAPPHGGIALGIDRWAVVFASQTNIREVMAFPKTQSGTRPDARGAVAARAEPVRGARPALRRRAGTGRRGGDRCRERPGATTWSAGDEGPRRQPGRVNPLRAAAATRGSRPWRARCASRSRGSSTAGPRSAPRPASSSAACTGCRSWRSPPGSSDASSAR